MDTVSSARKWGMFAILMFAGICINASQLKITPITTEVSALLNVDLTQTALLTSIFTVAGVILSVPGSLFIDRTGPKRMELILMAALFVGNVMGALTDSFPVMMASRVVEGASCALIIPVGLSLINSWFEGRSASLATGIFTIANPVANFVIMNASLGLVDMSGGNVKAIWWCIAGLALVAFILVLIFVRDVGVGGSTERVSLTAALSNAPLVVLCIGMMCLSFVLLGLVTDYPQIFAYNGLAPATANFYTSLNGLFGIPCGVICGILIGKTNKPFTAASIGAVGGMVVSVGIASLGPSTYVANVLGSSVFLGGLGITSMFVLAPRLAQDPAHVGQATGLLNAFYYAGILVSTPVLSLLSQGNTTWVAPSVAMTVACAGLLACVLVSRKLSVRQGRAVHRQVPASVGSAE